jgi:hypothetical protein
VAKQAQRPSSTANRRQFTEEELVKWTKVVPIDSIRPHPQNPNNGDQERIDASLAAHGQFRTVILSEDNVLLAGNHTYAGKMAKGDKKIAVIQLPLQHDAPQAMEIMVADNHIGRKGKDDKGIMEAVLGVIRESQGDLIGSGFTDTEYEKLISANDTSDEGLSANLEYKVIVDCDSEAHQVELLEAFEKQGLKVKALIA